MGTIWVREFTGGLDTRRMPETTAGGALLVGNNGHISRGGDFEKRAAFVPEYTLPADTIGMAAGAESIYVFGDIAPPVMPSGVLYQRLQHPDGVTPLLRILSYDLNGSKIYVVGEFEDGSIFHFYDGVRVDDWYDGRARAIFEVTGGAVTTAVSATGTFEVTGGTANIANQITAVTIDGVNLISGAVTHTGDNATTAAAVANAINSNVSVPDYTAASDGQLVTITAVTPGTSPNGKAIVRTVTGDFTTGNATNMNGGAAAVSSSLIDLKVNGVSSINSPVLWSTSNEVTAANIAAAINGFSSNPEYVATAAGPQVTIISSVAGAEANGRTVEFTLNDGFEVTPSAGLVLANGSSTTAVAAQGSITVTGGTANVANQLTSLTIDGVNVLNGAVTHTGNNTTTAAAIAASINAAGSAPDYTATSSGPAVTITASLVGAAANGRIIVPTVTGNFTTGSVVNMAGGVDDVYQPGEFVKTAGKKMYSTAGSVLHFSGIGEPAKWTTDNVGAGFIDMASETSGAEQLTALARYQQYLAVFAERTVIIEYIDPDPALNRVAQVLNNTGTLSPKSVTQFGDNDIFYLDESGLRSLRARDSSNSAASTDIGVPVDTLVVEKLNELTIDERRDVIGAIEPRDGRFWLAMKNVIFVFSFFNGAQVSAWSTYTPSVQSGDEVTEFNVDEMVVFKRRVYIRSGDTIYVYGGLSTQLVYDDTVAEAWLPYLDAGDPSREKAFTGIDAAVQGEWEVFAAMQPVDTSAEDKVATLFETSFNHDGIPAIGRATHISLRFRSKGSGAAKLSSAVIHYEGDQNENK